VRRPTCSCCEPPSLSFSIHKMGLTLKAIKPRTLCEAPTVKGQGFRVGAAGDPQAVHLLG
jgi:hypothetical protein